MSFFNYMNRFCMEADGGASGAGSDLAADPAADDTAKSEGDGLKTGPDAELLAKAQELADGMVRKRLKGVSKEDIEDYKTQKGAYEAWKADKLTAEEKAAEATKSADARQKALNAKEFALDAKIAAQTVGIKGEYIDDAVVLVTARVSDDVTLETAMKEIAGKNPGWIVNAALPGAGGNPPGQAKNSFETRLAEAREKKDNVEAIRIKQEAAEAGVYLL